MQSDSGWHVGEIAQEGGGMKLEREVEVTFRRILNVLFKSLVFVGNCELLNCAVCYLCVFKQDKDITKSQNL